jgi:uncharacterized delta-60 repeat protein
MELREMTHAAWRFARAALALVGCIALNMADAAAATGDLDATFDASNAFVVEGVPLKGRVAAIHTDAAGRLVVGAQCGSPAFGGFCVARLLADGRSDPTFNAGKTLLIDLANAEWMSALAIDSLGRIVVGGACHTGPGPYQVSHGILGDRFCAARIATDGKLDTTFGSGGKALIAVKFDEVDAVGLMVDSRDGVLIGAQCRTNIVNYGYARENCVLRLKPDGTVDAAYGTDGVVGLSGRAYPDFHRLVAMPGGKFLFAGTCSLSEPYTSYACLGRFNENGGWDTTFNAAWRANSFNAHPTGSVLTPLASGSGGFQSAIAQPDGGVLALGTSTNGFLFVKYTQAGALDHGFGQGGIAETHAGPGSGASAFAQDARGRVVIAGTCGPRLFWQGGPRQLCMARLDAAGRVDGQFGLDGRVHVDTARKISPNALAFDAQDRILVGGYCADDVPCVIRLKTDGPREAGTTTMLRMTSAANPTVGPTRLHFEVEGDAPTGYIKIRGAGFDCREVLYDGKPASCYLSLRDGVHDISAEYVGDVNNRPSSAQLRQTVTAGGGVPAVQAIEYYNAGTNHYFSSSTPYEQGLVDTGAAGSGWVRTGEKFNAFGLTGGPPGVGPVCRFYGSITPGPNSHFYTASPDECAYVRQLEAATPSHLPRWHYEGLVFTIFQPVGTACPSYAPVAIYRLYNKRAAQNDSNHRFVTKLSLYNDMVSRGWAGEGIVMCAVA